VTRFTFSALVLVLLSGCSEPEIVALECGDLRVDAPEVCDEGDQNGLPGHCSADCSTEPAIVAVEGDVLAFLTEVEGPRIAGATVSILEHPEMRVTTGDDAHFRFEGLLEGTDVTLLVEHPDIKTTQTATITLGPQGIHPFSVQVVPTTIFNALSALVPMPVEEDKYCVIASTVARMGGSLYVRLRQGAPDVQVALEPAVPAESGPIYFDEDVLPAIMQPATSIDGGVLFYRVPPGDYVMNATRADTVFNKVRFQCRAGIVVNAGPPMGLLANVPNPRYGIGKLRTADDYSASTDALCEATASCVNQAAGSINYPDVMLASCKAMFADMWTFVDAPCDTGAPLRNAARALYACRATSCDVTLGGDEACTAEEAAFTAAQVPYGACLASRPAP
jgi:hypothetical protein